MRVFIVAEAGVNHNGSEVLALEMVDCAAECGADAVKFQTFDADRLVRRGTATATYQLHETGESDQHALLRRLEISDAIHWRLVERCQLRGIEFMSTPFDIRALDFLISAGIRRVKVPSGEITNHPFIAQLAAKNLPIILSTGMSTLVEVLEAVDVIKNVRLQHGLNGPLEQMLTLLHCTSNYPASVEDVNLSAMCRLNAETGLPVGYSDHTSGISVALAAAALGATVIEKHFTLDRKLSGPDHRASLEPAALVEMIRGIREVEKALGAPTKSPVASELPIRDLVRRSVTVVRAIQIGAVVTQADVDVLRPGTGIPPKYLDKVIGRRVMRDLEPGTTLQWSDLA